MGKCQPEKCRRCAEKDTCPISSFMGGDDEQGFIYLNHNKMSEIFHKMLTEYQQDNLPEELFVKTMLQMVQFIVSQKKYYDGN